MSQPDHTYGFAAIVQVKLLELDGDQLDGLRKLVELGDVPTVVEIHREAIESWRDWYRERQPEREWADIERLDLGRAIEDALDLLEANQWPDSA